MNLRQMPGNESPLHYRLKWHALTWLLSKEVGRCKWAAPEVEGIHCENGRSKPDALGISRRHGNKGWEYTVKVVEVKISRSDFQAGYCTGGDLNYVMVPRGLVKSGELQDGVGLIELDGVCSVLTKRPRRMGSRESGEYPRREIEAILQRLSNMWRFESPYWQDREEESA